MADVLETNDNVENIIKNITLERGYKSYDFNIKYKFDKGENYLGDIKRADLIGVKQNGNEERLHLIIKTPPFNVRKQFPVNGYYERELFTYAVYLPMLCRMQDNMNIPSDDKIKFAELYGGSSEKMAEILVLEDLSFSGFKMYDRMKSLDYDHLMISIKTIAKYHALAFAIKQLAPELHEEGLKHSFKENEFGENFCNALEEYKNKSISIMKDEELKEKIIQFTKNGYFETIIDLMDVGKNEDLPYNIICHGDCWINNFLFQYDEHSNPKKMIMIDWQMNNYSSPVTDLAYLLFSSTDQDIRSKYWKDIFEVYYSTLGQFLQHLGCDVNVCYPEEVFQQHIKEKLPYGLAWSFMLVPIVLNSKDVAMDLNDLMGNESGTDSMKYSDKCIERLNGVVRDFIDLGL